MTYYVPKNDFYKGDVADADRLMSEFYAAGAAVSNVDQNNITKASISHTVAISPVPLPASFTQTNRQSGPFAAYAGSTLMYASGQTISAGDMINGDWVVAPTPITFTSVVTAHYTFYMQAYASRTAATAIPLIYDSAIFVNGSIAGGSKASSSANQLTGGGVIDEVPAYFSVTKFLEPGDWTVVPAFRSRVRTGTLPSIHSISFGVVGFIR